MTQREGQQESSGHSLNASTQFVSLSFFFNSSYKETGLPTACLSFLEKAGWSKSLFVINVRVQLCSEEVCLAHDTHELVLADLTIAITICFFDHLLDLVVCHVLTELLGDSF